MSTILLIEICERKNPSQRILHNKRGCRTIDLSQSEDNDRGSFCTHSWISGLLCPANPYWNSASVGRPHNVQFYPSLIIRDSFVEGLVLVDSRGSNQSLIRFSRTSSSEDLGNGGKRYIGVTYLWSVLLCLQMRKSLLKG